MNALPKITIVGAGSIGCYLGGCLVSQGGNVTLIGRPRIQKEINENGLHITDWRGRNETLLGKDINFSLSIDAVKEADFVLVTVKSGDTAEIAENIAPFVKPTAIIVSFQNGVCNADILKQFLPDHTTLKGMVPFNVIGKGNAHFHCGTEGNLAIEDRNKSTTYLIDILGKGALNVDVYEDLSRLQWTKLLMNLNNSINALSGIPLLEQLHDTCYRKILALTIKEALSVLSVANIKPIKNGKVIPKLLPIILLLPNFLYKIVASSMLKIDPDARSSMYEDLALKRKTEINFINGEIVALAKRYNTVAPINYAITQLIREAEQKKEGSPMLSASKLYTLITK